MNHKKTIRMLLVLGMGSGLAACNLYAPFNSPSSDPQYLSAARACFDQGDYACAREMYSKMSADSSETVAADMAFLILDENGATMGAFMSSLGTGGDIAGGINKLAGTLSNTGGTASETKRLAILSAFQKTTAIPTNRELRGLVRFLSSMALMAEILAENSSTAGLFRGVDLVKNPAACLNNFVDASECATAFLANNNDTRVKDDCGFPAGNKLVDGAITGTTAWTLPTASTTRMTGSPSLGMVNASLKELIVAMDEVGASLSLGGDISGLAKQIIQLFEKFLLTGTDYAPAPYVGAIPECYRFGLLSKGIGGK